MSLRIDTSEWISGSLLIGEPGLGVLGSAIPSSGGSGAGYAYNDLSLPADNAKEICGRVTTWPTNGTLFAYEDTSFEYIALIDGADSFQYQLYVDGVATGSPITVTLITGTVNGSATCTPASLSISAPTATAAGTVPGEGLAFGVPASITLVAPTATASGEAGITNGYATGAPKYISITAPTATASNGLSVRAPAGSGPVIIKSASSRPINSGGIRR